MKKYTLLALLLIIAPGISIASSCEKNYLDGLAPVLNNKALINRGHTLCYQSYNVYTSGLTKTAVWTSEKLHGDNLAKASKLERKDTFHAEESIPESDRAELSDYLKSGYDRGHMAPNGDMPNKEAQYESFSLANMIPQNKDLNRGLWKSIETSVREAAKADGTIYVVTGPAFFADENGELTALKGRVVIPTHVWKAVYNPKTKSAGAYWVKNEQSSSLEQISLNELNKRTGIDAFSALPAEIKSKVELPSITTQPRYRAPKEGNKFLGIFKAVQK